MEQLIKELKEFYFKFRVHHLHDDSEEMKLNLDNMIDNCHIIIKKCEKLKKMINV